MLEIRGGGLVETLNPNDHLALSLNRPPHVVTYNMKVKIFEYDS